MTMMKTLGLAALIGACSLSQAGAGAAAAASPPSPAAAPASGAVTASHLQAVTDLMAAMQMEKMMRTITGSSRYASEAQRSAAYAKLASVAPAQIHARLAQPLTRTISAETAREMARFYASSYGKKVVHQMYNSKASYGEPAAPGATAAERADMQRPAFVKASKALAAADGVIRHEGFVLLQAIAR